MWWLFFEGFCCFVFIIFFCVLFLFILGSGVGVCRFGFVLVLIGIGFWVEIGFILELVMVVFCVVNMGFFGWILEFLFVFFLFDLEILLMLLFSLDNNFLNGLLLLFVKKRYSEIIVYIMLLVWFKWLRVG